MRKCLIVFALFVGAGSAAAQDDLVAAGKFEFFRCTRCHNTTATATVVKKGPHLHNLFGRKPGSLPGFEFSEAMVTYGRDKVWDETTLAAFLRDPNGTVPGNKMVTADSAMDFKGIEKDEEVRALIAYLATLDPDGMAPQ
jgi:cytochrome c